MSTKYTIIIIIIVGAVAYASGRYLQPPKTITKEVQVVKEVEVVKRDVRTVIKEVSRPDGTKIRETVIEDKSKEAKNKDQTNTSTKLVESLKPQWKVQGLVGINEISNPTYGVGVERRIIGPVFAGVWVNTQKQYGVSVSLEF